MLSLIILAALCKTKYNSIIFQISQKIATVH